MKVKTSINPRGVLFALAAILLWSGNFVVIRYLAWQVPPATLATIRWFLAVCMLAPFCYKAFIREWPGIKKHWLYYFFAASTGATLFVFLTVTAAHTTNVLNMTLIATSAPIFTLVIARVFLKEALTPARILGITVALAGVILLAVRGNLATLLTLEFQPGDLLTLCAAIMFGTYTVQLRYKPLGTSLFVFGLLTFIIAFFSTLPLSIWELSRPGTVFSLSLPNFTYIAYLALGPSVLAFWLWAKAVASLGPANASLLYYTLPFFAGMAAVVMLGEPVLWVHLVSGALIIFGILAATKK